MKRAGIGGLFARVQFNLRAEKGREAFANVAFYGEEQEWSIGYKTLDAIYDNQRQANLLREVELYEVSPVLHGANQLTGTISIKAAEADKAVDSFKKSKWPMFDREFAERIKRDYPQIWAAGGNIKGNDQYRILTQIAEQGGGSKSTAQTNALELREAWVARHAGDFRLPGVIAQIKWLAIGSRGEDYMKNVVREAIAKHDAKMKEKAYAMPTPDLDEEMDEEKGHGGMMMSLASAIGKRFGGPVRIRHADSNMVIFDHMMGGKPHTMRVAYHFDGDEFMFGKPVGVKPKVIYMPEEDDDDDDSGYDKRYEDVDKPSFVKPKAGCSCGQGKDASEDLSDFFDDAMKALDAFEAEAKAGRSISRNNIQKLQQAIEILKDIVAAGGRTEIEMKEKSAEISANIEDIFFIKDFLDPVFKYHNLETTATENGIEVKGLLTEEASEAISLALSACDYDAELMTEDISYTELQ
jgi:hypothetical protein